MKMFIVYIISPSAGTVGEKPYSSVFLLNKERGLFSLVGRFTELQSMKAMLAAAKIEVVNLVDVSDQNFINLVQSLEYKNNV